MIQWFAELGGRFHTAFVAEDRWKLYLDGLVVTLELTVLALILGVAIGLVVAVIRSAHDQQRPGRRNPLLGFVNALLNIYTTVIRGTPMMVQVLIWCFVIFTSSRNKIMVGAIGLGVVDACEEEELRAQMKGSGMGTSATRAEILKKLCHIQ